MFISEWNASFYDEGNAPTSSKKEWKYGVLKLFLGKILFSQDKIQTNDKNQPVKSVAFELELHFCNIGSFKGTSSSLIFPAIIIYTTKGEKLWFSSFNNRDETLLFLNYFFHSTLEERPIKFNKEDLMYGAESTNAGSELLRSVVDSNTSLANAGNKLIEQGQQLRNASVQVCEMNQNLAVASRFTHGLKSWFPRWRIPKSYAQESFQVLNKDDVLDINSYNALYHDATPGIKGSYLQCIVTTEKRGLSIVDEYQKLIQHFKWADISRVQVITVWELCITQYLIGKPDRKCSLVCINVQQLLKEIEKYRPSRAEAISPEVTSAWSIREKILKDGHHNMEDTERQESKQRVCEEEDFYTHHKKSSGIPSNQEMAELSRELTSLKSMALDVQKVQDEQLKDIDALTAAVTKETDHLSKLNKTVNRML